MASSRRQKRRRRKIAGGAASKRADRQVRDGNATPVQRLPTTFRVLYEVAHAADTTAPIERTRRSTLQMSLFVRGVNALKAIRLLLSESHWEFAAAIARQLFELVVNVEFLRAEDDEEAALVRYVKFGLMQGLLGRFREAQYAERTGRAADPSAQTLAQLLDETFPEFRTKTAGGKVRWATSWAGKTTRALAEASQNPLRVDQYEQLFSEWSEQAHASPGAISPLFFRSGTAASVERMLTDDEPHVAETGAMAVWLFIELWRLLDDMPAVDERRVKAWTHDLAIEGARFVKDGQLQPDDRFFDLLKSPDDN